MKDRNKDGEMHLGLCQGLAVYMYEKKDENRLRERVILLGHPSEDICTEWMNRLLQAIKGKYMSTCLNLDLQKYFECEDHNDYKSILSI